MPATRLSPLDAAFLEVESPTAHMHVGWASVFAPPEGRRRPSFEELREHIARRLPRAPRFRQLLAGVPLGMHNAEWIDDPRFEIADHVVHSRSTTLSEVVDSCMSVPLPRDRPLWQLHLADRLADGNLALVGKAHHCMVDGIAAVEMASLLVDPEPDATDPEPEPWRPGDPPGQRQLFLQALADRIRDQVELATTSIRLAASPRRLLELPSTLRRGAKALADSARPAAGSSSLNEAISPFRHLAVLERPLDDLRTVKQAFGTTINDVLLAVSAGGVRRFLENRDDRLPRLKAMVPVNVRGDEGGGDLGNRISFIFVDLPCEEGDPVRRLEDIRGETTERKDGGQPEASDALLRLVAYVPRTLQAVISRLVASPRVFNLVVSNIPGPREPLYMRGCELRSAFPVVPIADRHALSIGFTTVGDRACFGLYADREALPDSDILAAELDRELDQLLAISESRAADMVVA